MVLFPYRNEWFLAPKTGVAGFKTTFFAGWVNITGASGLDFGPRKPSPDLSRAPFVNKPLAELKVSHETIQPGPETTSRVNRHGAPTGGCQLPKINRPTLRLLFQLL
jgi:hypothetical protein